MSYSFTDDVEILDAKLEFIKDEGVKAKNRLEGLNRLKTLAAEENLADIVEELGNRAAETSKRYEVLKENYMLVRERRDSLPV